MKSESRADKSVLNVFLSMGSQIVLILAMFLSRTIFIKVLGAEYLGINGLFSNVLSVLSIADLGFGTSIIYSMYKPLAEKNEDKLAALIGFYKKLYIVIAAVVMMIGIIILPFLHMFVNTEKHIDNLEIYYLLFLANSVMSYLLTYRATIINADQKMYLTKIYTIVFTIIQFVLQVIILLLTGNYILYLIIQIICTLGNNIYASQKANKLYPYIKKKVQLESSEKKDIFKNIKAFFVYKLGGIILNHTDNILISIMIGTIYVGYYSNYSMIINTIVTLTSVIFISMSAGVGNLNTTNDKETQYKVFNVLIFLSLWVFGFCSICFITLFNDFILLWIGNEFLLDIPTVIVIVVNFYILGIMNPIWIYRETTGLFRQTKYVYLITAILNLILSIILGKLYGLFGILFATVISRLLTNVWFEPYKLYKSFFNKKCGKYFVKQIANIALLFGIIFLINIVIKAISIDNLMLMFIVKLLICAVVPNFIFWILFRKTEEFQYIYEKTIKKYLHRKNLAKT